MNREEIDKLLAAEFVTVADVQRILDLSATPIIRKIESGELEGVNIAPKSGRATWRIRSRSVKKLLGLEEDKLPLQSVI